jgi:SAM-dependent methyltransferase
VRRERCAGCGGADLTMVLDLGLTPPANLLPASPGDPETFWPLQLGVCPTCWLVQQLEIVPDEVLWSADYAFYSGASGPKVAYHQDLSERLLTAWPKQARRLTVEVACNDGDLLRHFADAGCTVLGVDPAPGPARVARERGLPVYGAPFTTALADTLRGEHGPAGLIIANHVVAHVVDLDDFLTGITLLLAPDGVVVFEVQYLMDLIVGNQLDHVYHEHRAHFSLTSLAAVCARHDLHVAGVRHTPAQSGSISVTLTRQPVDDPHVNRMLTAERWLLGMSAYTSLQGRADHIRGQLLTLLDEEAVAGRRVAGYAAPAKATTLLNWCGIGPSTLRYVLDTTPYKQGRYTPGTHIPIVARRAPGGLGGRPMEAADTYLMLAWNYAGDVLRREYRFTAAGGHWIVPIPVPIRL